MEDRNLFSHSCGLWEVQDQGPAACYAPVQKEGQERGRDSKLVPLWPEHFHRGLVSDMATTHELETYVVHNNRLNWNCNKITQRSHPWVLHKMLLFYLKICLCLWARLLCLRVKLPANVTCYQRGLGVWPRCTGRRILFHLLWISPSQQRL